MVERAIEWLGFLRSKQWVGDRAAGIAVLKAVGELLLAAFSSVRPALYPRPIPYPVPENTQ